jgi:ABC-2 type transport system permease protein
MRSIYAIYRKEMGNYFVSPVAYVVVGVFLILAGFFFDRIVDFYIQNSLAAEMQALRFGTPPDIDVPSQIFRSFFDLLSSIILFLTPVLTMAVYSEERKRGTIELLMTSPITEAQIVIGKFLAELSLFAIMMIPTPVYVFFVYFHSDPRPPVGIVFVGYLGVLLLGGSLLALGGFISSLTENQIIAAVLTFGAFLMLWVIDLGGRGAGSAGGQVLQYISVIHHYDDFTRGIIDTSSLVYYCSFLAFFVFLTVRSIDSIRWRRA